MSWLSLGFEVIAGIAMIVGGIVITWLARGGQPTALGLGLIPVTALTLIVVGGALILNSARLI